MKYNKYIYSKFLLLIGLAIFVSCNESVNPFTEDAMVGGLIVPTNSSINYVVGNTGPYDVQLFLNQNSGSNIESIEIYKSFTGTNLFIDSEGEDSVVSYTSNEILDQTLSSSAMENEFIDFSYTFDELKDGLTVDGESLPTLDGDYRIGDFWSLKIVSVLSDGSSVVQQSPVNLTVSTRYAGKYSVANGEYWRLNSNDTYLVTFPEEIVIESVDATTYRQVEYFGAFEGNVLYFQVIDGVVTYPEDDPDGNAQTGNDQPLITCVRNPSDLTNVKCGASNYVVNDDINGEDKIFLSYGYYTAGSGAREFYQELTKIVE